MEELSSRTLYANVFKIKSYKVYGLAVCKQVNSNQMQEKNLLSEIQSLVLETQIEYLGIINENGRLEDSMGRKELNLSREKKEMFFMQRRLGLSMENDFDNELGVVNYVVTERKDSKFVAIPVFSHIVLVIMNKGIDHIPVVKKIKTRLAVRK